MDVSKEFVIIHLTCCCRKIELIEYKEEEDEDFDNVVNLKHACMTCRGLKGGCYILRQL